MDKEAEARAQEALRVISPLFRNHLVGILLLSVLDTEDYSFGVHGNLDDSKTAKAVVSALRDAADNIEKGVYSFVLSSEAQADPHERSC